VLYTIGHSTRSLKEFAGLLAPHAISHIVDVRTVPRSARNPQYNREWLPSALQQYGLGYTHMEALGGVRHASKDSPDTGWRNDAFRGFSGHMRTEPFEHALEGLIALANRERVAIMCAEALPWRCHRSLIADALTVRGVEVAHIMNGAILKPHALTSFAKVEGTRITYPAPQAALDLDATTPH